MIAEEAKKISKIAREKNDTMLNSIFPQITEYINKEIKREASRGYLSYTFNMEHLIENTNFVDNTLKIKGVDTNFFKAAFLLTSGQRKLIKKIDQHYKNLDYTVGNNSMITGNMVFIRWEIK